MSRLRVIFDNLSNQAKFALLAGLLLLVREIAMTKTLNTAAATGILSIFGTMVLSTYAVAHAHGLLVDKNIPASTLRYRTRRTSIWPDFPWTPHIVGHTSHTTQYGLAAYGGFNLNCFYFHLCIDCCQFVSVAPPLVCKITSRAPSKYVFWIKDLQQCQLIVCRYVHCQPGNSFSQTRDIRQQPPWLHRIQFHYPRLVSDLAHIRHHVFCFRFVINY